MMHDDAQHGAQHDAQHDAQHNATLKPHFPGHNLQEAVTILRALAEMAWRRGFSCRLRDMELTPRTAEAAFGLGRHRPH